MKDTKVVKILCDISKKKEERERNVADRKNDLPVKMISEREH